MTAFEAYLRKQYGGRTRFERRTARRLFEGGGKRLRPSMTISAARLGAYERKSVFPAAAAVELIHTASLIHDDIIDHAETRRGQRTVSDEHGGAIAVYMGDYLLAQSLLALAESGAQTQSLQKLARGIRAMCSGEVEQYFSRYGIPSVSQYLRRVMCKTALLFSASCALGGYCAKLPERTGKTLGRFGFSFGVAFQIRDDILDLQADAQTVGKPVLHDVAEGIVTLPTLFAIERDPAIKAMLADIFSGTRSPGDLPAAVREAGGFARAESLIARYADKCRLEISRLPDEESRKDFARYLTAIV